MPTAGRAHKIPCQARLVDVRLRSPEIRLSIAPAMPIASALVAARLVCARPCSIPRNDLFFIEIIKVCCGFHWRKFAHHYPLCCGLTSQSTGIPTAGGRGALRSIRQRRWYPVIGNVRPRKQKPVVSKVYKIQVKSKGKVSPASEAKCHRTAKPKPN